MAAETSESAALTFIVAFVASVAGERGSGQGQYKCLRATAKVTIKKREVIAAEKEYGNV